MCDDAVPVFACVIVMKREGKSGKGLNILRKVRLQEIVKPGQLVQLGTELTTGKMMTLRTALSVEVKRRQKLRKLRGEDICLKPHRSKLALFIRESSGSLLSKNCRAFYSNTSLALFPPPRIHRTVLLCTINPFCPWSKYPIKN
jgi:hypothetical protein